MAWLKGTDKGIVFVKDKDTKLEIIKQLNAVGLFGEKVIIDAFVALLGKARDDKTVKYIVFVGATCSEGEIVELCDYLAGAGKMKFPHNIIFLSSDQEGIKERLEKKFPLFAIKALPINKKDMLAALIGPVGGLGAAPIPAQPPTPKAEKPSPSEQKPDPQNINFVETTKHLQKTIELINQLAKDLTQKGTLESISQRFNGLTGTFAFFKTSEGYRQLFLLARIIDDIGRTYVQKSEAKEVEKAHFDLVFRSAKCAFLILKSLRANEAVSPEQNTEVDALNSIYNSTESILKRESKSQEEIDALLDSL